MKTHGGGYGKAGVPDILACIKGHFVGFEVKTETGTTTALQDRTMLEISAAGGYVAVVRSTEQVARVLFMWGLLDGHQ